MTSNIIASVGWCYTVRIIVKCVRPGHMVQHCMQYCVQWLNCIVSTPEIIAHNIACNIAAVESPSTSATLRTTNCCVKHVARNVAPCVRAFTIDVF